MKIGGIQKVSLIDFPSNISCVIFTQGCNFRCKYCHNPELVYPELFQDTIPEEVVLDYLKQRIGILDGVVLTGGEPTLQKEILDFVKEIKKMGYKIKLDTNGYNPEPLQKIIPFLNYIAMDIKTFFDVNEYSKVCGVKVEIEKIKESLDIIINSGIDCEFRTTVDEQLVSFDDVEKIKHFLKINYGANKIKYKVQKMNKFMKRI